MSLKQTWMAAGAVALVGAVTACGGGGRDRDRDAGRTADAGRSSDGGAEACSAENPRACAYAPEGTFEFMGPLAAQELTYTDVTGAERTVRITVRVPIDAPRPMPIVVYSHGGRDGVTIPANSGVEWSETFARAGFLTVSIAHSPRTDDERAAICEHYGITTFDECVAFKYLHHDRAYDVRRVLDWIDDAAAGAFAGEIDTDRILHAGHSAGSGGGAMVAGASRDFNGMTRTAPDPRPRAFIGFSIEGPLDDGFTDASFATVDRPHLSVTGVGDTTSESDPAQRRRVFELMPAGDKYRFWSTDPSIRHGSFNLEQGGCEDFRTRIGEPTAFCGEAYGWMRSAALAFADAYLRDRPEALAWLESDAAEILSGSVIEWDHR